MTKIQFLITHNDHGGAQDAIIKCSNLLESNIERDINCLYDLGRDLRIKPICSQRRYSLKSKYIDSFFCFLSKIKSENINTVISFLPLANLYNALAGIFSGSKVIISHRNPVDSYSLLMRILDLLCAYAGMYDVVICNSKAVADSLYRYPKRVKRKIKIVNNYIVPKEDFYTISQIENLINIKLQNKYCLALGRLSSQKRFDILIEAVKDTDFQLIIAGDGELKEKLCLQAMNMNNVHLVGHCDIKLATSLLKYAHIYLQPSEYEGQSNSLLEAVFSDAIIISSDIPPQREVIVDGDYCLGVLVDNFSVDSWSNVIRSNMHKDSSIFSHAKEVIRINYTFSAVKDSLNSVLRMRDVK